MSRSVLPTVDRYGAPPGSLTVNTEPLPDSLATVRSPPIMRASLRVMASPSPVPPKRCAVALSAWVNSSNSFAYCESRQEKFASL